MKYRSLGKLSSTVSEIGLGTAQLANLDGRYKSGKPVSSSDALSIVRSALDAGINFFDTGDQYGDAEMLLGSLSPSDKNKITIATKAGLRSDGIRDFSSSYLRQQIELSLRRLRVDSLALFQLNKPSDKDLVDGRLFALLGDLKKEGKIRAAGVVVGESAAGERCLTSDVVDALQVLYNLLYRQTENLIAAAHKKKVGVIVRSPLNSGLLSGRYTPQTIFQSSDERSEYFSGPRFEERLSALKNIQDDLRVPDEQLLEFSLVFLLSNPGVSCVIPGASTVDQLHRYANCSKLPKLGSERMGEIMAILQKHTEKISQIFQN